MQTADLKMTASRFSALLNRRALVRFGMVAALTVTLAACGKRGPLEPPPGSADAVKAQPQSDQQTIPGIRGGKKRPPPVKPPKNDFFLDFLL